MRRSPYELKKTFRTKKILADKIRENVASEILGVSLYDALKTFGKRKIVEIDTTGKMPEHTADEIMFVFKTEKKAGSRNSRLAFAEFIKKAIFRNFLSIKIWKYLY